MLALAASSAVLGSPTQFLVGSEAELAEKWSYSDCGARISFDPIDAEPELTRRLTPGLPTDIIRLHSLELSPDPPKPGENLTVTASGTVLQTIEVRIFLLHVNARSTHPPFVNRHPGRRLGTCSGQTWPHQAFGQKFRPLRRSVSYSPAQRSLPLTALFITLIKLLYSTCSEKADMEIQCPVQPGDYTITQTVELPKEIPPAKFVVNVNAYTKDDDDMLCLQLRVDFTHFPGRNLLKQIGV